MRTQRIATAWTATILGMALLAGGCSSAKKDQDLANNVKGQMFSVPQLRSANLDVAVKDGEVTLSGEVPDDTARYQAYKLAADTPGVKHVVDKLAVQTAQAAAPADNAPVAPPPPAPAKRVRKTARRNDPPQEQVDSAAATPAPESAPAPVPPPSQVAEAPAPPPLPPPPPQPTRVEIPAGTSVRVQMIDGVDSSKNQAGEIFRASLDSPIVVDNQIVVPAGTDVYVKLTSAKSAGRIAGQSELALELTRMEFQGKAYSLATSQYTQTGASRGKRTAETVGGGAAIGALLGAVIGHGKGAAIGAATGAGAGTVVQGATKGQQIQIKSETKLDFSLEQPVEVSYFPDKNRSTRR
jgi:hypothetical protein